MSKTANEQVRISFADLKALLGTVFVKHGVSIENAAVLAANCASCERDGSLSHGIFRIGGYIASLKSGWVDGTAVGRVEEAGAAMVRIDARNGFAQPALAQATALIMEKAKAHGSVVVAIRDSHHFSALWPDLEPFAAEGFVALSMVSGLACVAPAGGRSAVMGTNPIAFATPVEGGNPLIYDFATSAMSNGDLRIASRDGHDVALGTGVDEFGNLTRDPARILNGGLLLPFGGHKGAAISLMVEVLASALTGGQFSFEVDFAAHPGAETPKTGQVLIVIDPHKGGNDRFSARVAQLIGMIRQSGNVRLPSDRRYVTRADAEVNGIPLSVSAYDQLLALAQ